MINLEQVKLLETKVAKAVDYVERVTVENAALLQKEAEMQAKLDDRQQRIEELEALITRFREEQGEIEDGILAALDKLSRFEEEMDKSLKGKGRGAAKDTEKAPAKPAVPVADVPIEAAPSSGGGEICFEIPENNTGDDIIDPLGGDADPPSGDGELDIF